MMPALTKPKGDWKPRAWIPNVAGTLVTVMLADGSAMDSCVQRRLDGTHHLSGVTDFGRVVAYKRRG